VKMRVFCVMRRLGGLDTNSQPGAKTETSVLSTDKTFTSAFSSIQHQDDACLGAEVGSLHFYNVLETDLISITSCSLYWNCRTLFVSMLSVL